MVGQTILVQYKFAVHKTLISEFLNSGLAILIVKPLFAQTIFLDSKTDCHSFAL